MRWESQLGPAGPDVAFGCDSHCESPQAAPTTFLVLPTPFFKSHSSQDSSSHFPLPAHCWEWHWPPGPPGFLRCLQAPPLTCQAGTAN